MLRQVAGDFRHRVDPAGHGRAAPDQTRDAKIQRRVAEVQAVLEHGASMVALTSKDATTRWIQLEVFMTQWRRIEQLHRLPGPFIYRASRTAPTRLDLSA